MNKQAVLYTGKMIFQGVRTVVAKYPITRGMLTYAGLWPAANLVEQYLTKKEELDGKQMMRFGIFGTFVVAPSLYVWAMVEQVVYAPFATSTFLIGMGALEGRSWNHICAEWQQKFLSTWKAGACIWPVVQTINFTFIKERNRVSFVAGFSFIWIVFLSYIKRQEVQNKESHHTETVHENL